MRGQLSINGSTENDILQELSTGGSISTRSTEKGLVPEIDSSSKTSYFKGKIGFLAPSSHLSIQR